MKLDRLHDVFQVVMGWTDSHMHQFHAGGAVYSRFCEDDSPDSPQLKEHGFSLADIAAREKARFIYEYDFGDGWEHEVLVEKILPADADKKGAICMTGKNACPPEDCGGIWGYYNALDAASNPAHDEHEEVIEWLGDAFDPSRFDPEEVNAMLKRLLFEYRSRPRKA